MGDTGFYGLLTTILLGALLGMAGHVDWASVPPVGVMLFLALALVGLGFALLAISWAADWSLARPLAHPIC